MSSPESAPSISLRRNNESSSTAVGLQNNTLKGQKASLSSKQTTPLSDALVKDSRPLLRLKFKTPYPGSWRLHGEEERGGSVKGQRSKRKRPSSFVEKPKQVEEKDGMGSHGGVLMNEMMDANWVLRKLGRDAIGKRVEVHQLSDNSWHKDVVGDVVEGISMLSIDHDDGRAKTLELGKQGIRFVPQKDNKRLNLNNRALNILSR